VGAEAQQSRYAFGSARFGESSGVTHLGCEDFTQGPDIRFGVHGALELVDTFRELPDDATMRGDVDAALMCVVILWQTPCAFRHVFSPMTVARTVAQTPATVHVA
jgi:hypothetical protein